MKKLLDDSYLKTGFLRARKITRENAKTFYFCSKLLPRDERYASYAVYAMCRISDDTVDIHSQGAPTLKGVEAKLNSAYSYGNPNEPLLAAFKKTINTYAIPREYFDELIKGMYIDLEKSQYSNLEELYDYCYKVAGIVGLIMLQIFGYNNDDAKIYAADLGRAMQITNILRDIKEDFDRGRIYLTREDMEYFRVRKEHIRDSILDKNFIGLIKFYIGLARQNYYTSQKGIKMIRDARARIVVCAMSSIYAGILKSIEKNGYDVFSKRAYVNTAQKLWLLAKVLLGRRYI